MRTCQALVTASLGLLQLDWCLGARIPCAIVWQCWHTMQQLRTSVPLKPTSCCWQHNPQQPATAAAPSTKLFTGRHANLAQMQQQQQRRLQPQTPLLFQHNHQPMVLPRQLQPHQQATGLHNCGTNHQCRPMCSSKPCWQSRRSTRTRSTHYRLRHRRRHSQSQCVLSFDAFAQSAGGGAIPMREPRSLLGMLCFARATRPAKSSDSSTTSRQCQPFPPCQQVGYHAPHHHHLPACPGPLLLPLSHRLPLFRHLQQWPQHQHQ